jgi:hypothetical protein
MGLPKRSADIGGAAVMPAEPISCAFGSASCECPLSLRAQLASWLLPMQLKRMYWEVLAEVRNNTFAPVVSFPNLCQSLSILSGAAAAMN